MTIHDSFDWVGRDTPIIVACRRGDLTREELDRDTILADPVTGQLHRLNETAMYVWNLCDGRTTARQIADRMMEAFEVDFEDAMDYVDQLVARFAESNLLELDA